MWKTIALEKKEGYAVIRIQRPEALNAITPEVLAELECAIFELERDDSVASVILTGSGEKAFIAGADIRYMSDITPLQALGWGERAQKILSTIEASGKVYIAAINGYALGGGCEIAMACDLRIASENARFGQPEINIGVIPGWGGTQRLTRLVGATKAKELIFTGDMIDAPKAEAIGLVNRVVPAARLMEEAEGLARKLKEKPPVALRLAKQSITFSRDAGFDASQQFERQAFAMLFSTADQKEGMRAFIEKRKPKFEGK